MPIKNRERKKAGGLVIMRSSNATRSKEGNMNDNEYYSIIDRCAEKEESLKIENSAPEHAAYLMKKFFEYAKSEVCIFTGHLNEKVFGDTDLIEKAKEFIKSKNHNIRIVVEDEVSDAVILDNVFVKSVLDTENKEGNLKINRLASDNSKQFNHFALMDNKAFRFELDHQTKKAIAYFKEQESANKLTQLFDHLFNHSTPISISLASPK